MDALADDVSDDEPDAALGELDGVEPVASDVDLLRTRQVARRDLRARQPRESDAGRTLRWRVSAIDRSDSK